MRILRVLYFVNRKSTEIIENTRKARVLLRGRGHARMPTCPEVDHRVIPIPQRGGSSEYGSANRSERN
jgi:hypothetical protein